MCVYVWAARMKHKAVRGRSRLDKLTFGTLNVRVAVRQGVMTLLARRNQIGRNFQKSWHLDTESILAVIAVGSKE